MKRYKKLLLVALSAMALVVAGCGGTQSDKKDDQATKSQTITVSAAASLQAAANELKDNFVKSRHLDPTQITLNFGGSGTLRQQIETGAPASIFISADEKNMNQLKEKNLVTKVKPLVENSLVLIVPKGKEKITIDQLPSVNRLAIGTVETVPAGKYAKQTLTKLNLWDQVESKIVYAKDVKAVGAYVAEGSADAGFVYKTDAMDLKDRVEVAAVAPNDSHDPIRYPIGIVTKYDNELAQQFYEYLTSNEAQQILQKYGFTSVANSAK